MLRSAYFSHHFEVVNSMRNGHEERMLKKDQSQVENFPGGKMVLRTWPEARDSHAMVSGGVGNFMYLFGGNTTF